MRISMNMRTVFSLLIALFLVSTLNITTSFAQDSTQVNLPDGARARLGKGRIVQIAYSPDGSRLAVGSSIGIWIYDARTGAEMALIGGHTSYVESVAFSPDGTILATGTSNTLAGYSGGRNYIGTVRLWDANTGTLLNTFTGHTNWVNSIAFSPDGTTLASGSRDETVRL